MKKFLSCLGLLAVTFGMFSAAKAVKPGDGSTFKVLLVGNKHLGGDDTLNQIRSCLVGREDSQAGGYHAIQLLTNNELIDVGVVEISGDEDFQSVARTLYSGASAALVLCDPNSLVSVLSAGSWVQDIRKYCGDISMILVGDTKKMKNGSTPYEMFCDALKTARNNLGVSDCLNVSTNDGENISDLMNLLGNYLQDSRDQAPYSSIVEDNGDETTPEAKKGSCLLL